MADQRERHETHRDLLRALAHEVRRRRHERGLTRAEVALRSGISPRFLARIEAGQGNISVLRLDALARAIGSTAADLLGSIVTPARRIALVGTRGAGKSSVGPLLAAKLGVRFIEMDDRIVEQAGLSVDQIFELHGERHYRRLEYETLRAELERPEPTVLAASGGVVNEAATWELLHRSAVTVWLRARPEDHWRRVIAQGDRRPMADNPAAMDELRALLSARTAVYSQADLIVDTTTGTPEDVAARIARELDQLEQRSERHHGSSPRETASDQDEAGAEPGG